MDCVKMTIEEIDQYVKLREGMRKVEHWREADQVRQELDKIGIILEDRRDGTTMWRYK